MKTINKLDFKPSTLPCYPDGIAYETPKYRVVFYDYSTSGGMIRPCKHWRAYTLPNGMYINGDIEYKTKTEAIKACQKHYESKEADNA